MKAAAPAPHVHDMTPTRHARWPKGIKMMKSRLSMVNLCETQVKQVAKKKEKKVHRRKEKTYRG